MKKVALIVMAGAVLVALAAAPAVAQTTEVSGGYALMDWDGCCGHGFGVDVAQAIKSSRMSSIAVVGDFSLARFSGRETDLTYTGGVRFTFLKDKVVAVFAQGTAGLMQSRVDAYSIYPVTTYNDLLVGGGGGVRVRLTKPLDLKAQVDIWGDYYGDLKEWHQVTRFLVAAVFKFGAK